MLKVKSYKTSISSI